MNKQVFHNQLTFNSAEIENISTCKNSESSESLFNNEDTRFKCYNMEMYERDINSIGLERTWEWICEHSMYKNDNCFFDVKNYSELYEYGLAIQDKLSKKKSGQYYTPDDVASIMGGWLLESDGENICDVGCGTGRLILAYLELLNFEEAKSIIKDGKLFLYDQDPVALKICRMSILEKYGISDQNCIHTFHCDFLDKKIILPSNAKVISNPPYASISKIGLEWENTDVIKDTNELYSAFMEKIFLQAKSAVIISPFSFLSGEKFYALRKKMCDLGNGFIVSFDNIPGNIFCGKKIGIFNSNTSNSVRAAITVFQSDSKHKGFMISPLIRFKNEERTKLLDCSVLNQTINHTEQIITKQNKMFAKIYNDMQPIFDKWQKNSEYTLAELTGVSQDAKCLYIPNSCRYFTTASSIELHRRGCFRLYIQNQNLFMKQDFLFNFLYCFINSSFAYWWWRIFDGGIVYPIHLLKKLPVPFNLASDEDISFFNDMAFNMQKNEKKYISIKMNAGTPQENIKFPEEYRNSINERNLRMLDVPYNASIFDKIHSNKFLDNSQQ